MTFRRRSKTDSSRTRRGVRLGVWLLVLLVPGALLAHLVEGRPGVRGELDAAVPATLADQITVLGLPNARFWAWDTQGSALVREWEQSLERERAASQSYSRLPPAHFLAVSGGGGDGAFGAGLICGWSDIGAMPTFKLVTGVSTGSMIAPFGLSRRIVYRAPPRDLHDDAT
jgi:hypothetical protein